MKTLLPFFLLLAATTWVFGIQEAVPLTAEGPVIMTSDGTPIPPPPPGPKQPQ